MYRVILADDEMLDLEGMELLMPWKELGMEVVYQATNAYKVLEYLRDNEADVLVTDIRMPIMSGLELVRKLKDTHLGIKVVFVSGHEEFQYARQAIQMNANGYVLKPVDQEELIRVLQEIRSQLDTERYRGALDEKYRESAPLIREQKMKKWLRGEYLPAAEEDWLAEAELEKKESNYTALLAELDDAGLNYLKRTESDSGDEQADQAMKVIESCSRLLGALFAFRIDPIRMLLVIDINEESAEARGAQLLSMVREQLNGTITVAAGTPFSSLAELPAAYSEASRILEHKWLSGKNRLIRSMNIEERDSEGSRPEMMLDELFNAMMQYDLVKIDDCLESLFAFIKRLDRKLHVQSFAQHILSKLDTYLESVNENLESLLGIRFEQLDILYHFETVYDIQSWMRRRFFEISESLQRKKQKKNHKIMKEIEDYVNAHLDRSIELREVADRFSFSPNYLGHLFKEERGVTFSEFVIRQRLAKAHEMLQDPVRKVYEVAFSVGYKNLTHFNKLFRDAYGLSPNEFRRQR
ncbi:response regulator [Paenibacillus glycanilyticus]|uniref:response regulator n=1 Tax=Paenibacillus glycanilyticus TaxID=126569 RepID=UPI003EBA9688